MNQPNLTGKLNIIEKDKRVITQVRGRIQHSQALWSQTFVIFKEPCTNLDVFTLQGKLIQSFKMDEILRRSF